MHAVKEVGIYVHMVRHLTAALDLWKNWNTVSMRFASKVDRPVENSGVAVAHNSPFLALGPSQAISPVLEPEVPSHVQSMFRIGSRVPGVRKGGSQGRI